ncbi:MAG: DNA polymerase III subunit delta [Candidatus Delongbacteria bacterium]
MAVKNKMRIKDHKIFFLSGEDQYSIDNKTEEIISEFLDISLKDFNFSHFNEENMNPELISSELYSLPVMADRRIILISDIDKGNSDLTSTISKFINKSINGNILILTARKPDKRRTFFKELLANKQCLAFEFKEKNEKETERWVRNYIAAQGRNISHGGLMLLSLTLSTNLSQVSSEIDKLLEYSSGVNITEDDIEKVLGVSKEYNIFKLQKSVIAKDLRRSLIICENILNNKNNRTDPIAINLFLSKTFISAFEISYNALSKGLSVERSASVLGYNNSWKDADTISCSKNYKTIELLRSMRYFLECDIKLKSSYQEPATAILIMLEKIIMHSEDNKCGYIDYFNHMRV